MTMKQCIGLYLRMKDNIFMGSPPYASEPSEKVLKEEFGENTFMSEVVLPKIMVTAVLAKHTPTELILFRNYESFYKIKNIPPPGPGKFSLLHSLILAQNLR